MNLEYQCVSLELAKQLKEAGVPQSSLYFWQEDATKEFDHRICARHTNDGMTLEFAAFTCSELGEMLPIEISKAQSKHQYELEIEKQEEGDWIIRYRNTIDSFLNLGVRGKTEADARAEMLLALIQNNLINPSNLK